jgi:tRNA A-37 threonylcarbamoyl transferase component Bud32
VNRTAAAADPFAAALRRLHAEAARCFGVPQVALVPIARESRRFSHILRLQVEAGAARYRAFLKILRPPPGADGERLRQRLAAEHDALVRVRACFAGEPAFPTVRPIACFPEQLALVTEEVPGETLLRSVTRQVLVARRHQRARLCDAVESVGTWLRRLQGAEPRAGRLSAGEVCDYIDVRLRQLVAAGPRGLTGVERDRVLRYVEARCGALAAADLDAAAMHGDLSPSNVIVNGTQVTVIDFGPIGSGARLHDLAHLHMQLDLLRLKPHVGGGLVNALQAALLRGYDPALDRHSPLFELLLVQHVACHFATLATRPGSGLAALYNRHVRRRHRRWLLARAVPREGI